MHPCYELRYTQRVGENDACGLSQFGEDYFKLHVKRRGPDHRALTLVDLIRLEIPRCSTRAGIVVDVLDALRVETVLPLPKNFRSSPGFLTCEHTESRPERRLRTRVVFCVARR